MIRDTTADRFEDSIARIEEITRTSKGMLRYAKSSDESAKYLVSAAKELDIMAGNARRLAMDMRLEAAEMKSATPRKRRS